MDEIEVNYERAPRTVLCPMDGMPLKAFRRAVNEPSVFEHRDGTSHDDGLAALRAAARAATVSFGQAADAWERNGAVALRQFSTALSEVAAALKDRGERCLKSPRR